jgi:hypothetical protein
MEVTMRFQISIRDDGAYEVVDIQTGQVRFAEERARRSRWV